MQYSNNEMLIHIISTNNCKGTYIPMCNKNTKRKLPDQFIYYLKLEMSAHQMDTYPNQHEYIFRHKVELHADYEINWVQSQIEFSRERIYCI